MSLMAIFMKPRHHILLLLLLAFPMSSQAQHPDIKVTHYIKVINALNESPELGVEVVVTVDSLTKIRNVRTDATGVAKLELDLPRKKSLANLFLQKEGFAPLLHRYSPYQYGGDTLLLMFHPKSIQIPEVVVLGRSGKYSSENNSAVELVKRTAEAEQYRRDSLLRNHTYQQVEKLTLSFAGLDMGSQFFHQVFPFFHYYVVPSKLDDKLVLPLSQRETVSKVAYNATEQKRKEAVLYKTVLGLDQTLDDGTLSIGLDELLPAMDFFQRHIKILDTQIPSPLSPTGSNHYHYYLTDTIIYRGKVAYLIDFRPIEPAVPSFAGRLHITADSIPRLLQSDMVFPKLANINFIDDLRVTQAYGEVAEGEWGLKEEQTIANVRLYLRLLSVYLENKRSYDHFDFLQPDSALLHSKARYIDLRDEASSTIYANRLKKDNVIATDEGLRHFLDELRAHRTHRLVLDLIDMIGLDYISTCYNRDLIYGGSYFDIGPISKMIAINRVEGLRVRLGGRTTGFVSQRYFGEGYVAYGYQDAVLKYGATLAASFNKKRYFREEYPRHELSLSHSYDLHTPGRVMENTDRDNLLYNVGVSYLTTRSYRRIWSLEYLNDFSSDLSLRLYTHHITDYPSGSLEYVRVNKDHSLEKLESITDVLLGVEWRWSPGEKIFPGSMQRQNRLTNLQREVPVYRLKHEWASKRFGGDYNRHRTELSVEHRLWLGTFGRLDYQLKLGKLWSAVPFPVLYTPPVNTHFWHRDHSFQLLRPLELIADEWASAFIQYHGRGVLFDRIPGVQQLSLRGVLSFNFLFGHLTDKNRQATGTELFVLPTISTEMNHETYMEVGIGLENILKFGRIDLFRRITPLGEHSGSPWGIKLKVAVNF